MKPCRKNRLPSENVAYAVAKRMGKKGKFVKPYHCAACKAWHTGTNRGLRAKRIDNLFDRIAAELGSKPDV